MAYFSLTRSWPCCAVFDLIELFDVPFILQHLGDAATDLALGNEYHAPTDPVGVPDPSQHVRDGILIVHRLISLLMPLVIRKDRGLRTED